MRNSIRILTAVAALAALCAGAWAQPQPAPSAEKPAESAELAALRQAAETYPSDAVRQYNLGVGLAKAGRYEEAKAALQRADTMAADAGLKADARFNQGVIELESLQESEGAAGMTPAGQSADRLGALSRAERQFRRSLEASSQGETAAEAAKWIERVQRVRQRMEEESRRQQQQQQQQQQNQDQQQQGDQQQEQNQDEQGGKQNQQQGQQQQQQQNGDQTQQQQQQQQGQDQAQQLQNLARQQSQLSQQSAQSATRPDDPQGRQQRQQQQADVSRQTEQAAEQARERREQQTKEQQQASEKMQQKIDQAMREQAAAQEALDKGDDRGAAQAQQRAAANLAEAAREAAQQAEQPPQPPQQQQQPKPVRPQAEGEQANQGSAWDFTAAEILDKERRQREGLQRLRREARRIFVEKDW